MRLKGLPGAWLIIAALIGLDTLWLIGTGITVPLKDIVPSVLLVSFVFGLSFVYSRLRPDPRLAFLTDMTAKLIAYSISMGIFCYLVVTLRRPLIDAELDAADRALGFDWVALYRWVSQHTLVRDSLIVAYDSVIPQIGFLILLLVSIKLYERARFLLWFYIIASTTYIVIAGLWPAVGAFGYYNIAADTLYVQQFQALRSGDMKVLDLMKLQGVVQFPSFHLALAVACAYVARGIRYLFPAFVVLNVVVIAATPPIGGHFLADLWTSALLTAILIVLIERGLKSRPHS